LYISYFGASGDLTRRKLIPAVFELYKQDCFPRNSRCLEFHENEWSSDDFRKMVAEDLKEYLRMAESDLPGFLQKDTLMHLHFDDYC